MKKNVLGIIIALLLGCSLLMAQVKKEEQEKPHQDIVETVTVENIVVPVRVFDQQKAVPGLTKSDFQLFVNGKPHEINGFYELRKKINAAPATTTPESGQTESSRLFVLIFNLCDYHQNVKGIMDVFFADIIRPGDYLIVISNHFFFPEWKLEDVEKTKQNILALLEKEKTTLKSDWQWFRGELLSMAANLKSRLEDEKIIQSQAAQASRNTGVQQGFDAQPFIDIFKEFFINYNLVLEDMQEKYMKLPEDRYIKIAAYLKAQQRDKWVFNFFQIGQLPLLDAMGPIQKQINSFAEQGADFLSLNALHFDYQKSISQEENILLNDIGKLFVDSGATFHTLLLKPINPGISEDFKLTSVSSDAEIMLKKISKQTGGSVTRSNSLKKFTQSITQKEDIIYELSYVPDSKAKKGALKITTGNKNYRVLYDDRSRIKPFEHAMRKLELEKPPVVIERMSLNNQLLTVQLSNIRLVQQDKELFGAVQAKIKIEDTRSKVISTFEKTYKGLKEEGIFQVEMPLLPKGKYNIVLEVKDLFSLDNRFVGDAITVSVK